MRHRDAHKLVALRERYFDLLQKPKPTPHDERELDLLEASIRNLMSETDDDEGIAE
jgi:hypothetical protein